MYKYLIIFATPLFLSGCYHTQITTGAPASNEVYQQAWATSFIAGLVPPSIVNAENHCSNGVAKVETRHSFLNMLAQMVTFSIYSPMEITVTCASSTSHIPANSDTIDLAADASFEDVSQAYTDAASLSSVTEKPVYL